MSPAPDPQSDDPPPGSSAPRPASASPKRTPAAGRTTLRAQLEAAQAAERSARLRADELAIVARKQSEMADELHAENRRLRDGEIREAVAPIIRGLARLTDEVGQLRSAVAEPGGVLELADLVHIDQRLHELLHDAGVTPLRPAAGDPFDVRLHEAAGTIPTEDPLQDRTVVATRRPGLIRDDGRVLRPATVIVHRFDTTSGPRA